MAEQIINNGASAGDPTAENIYTSFEKTKDNFSELYTAITTFLLKAGGTMTGVLQFANGTVSAPSAKVGSDQKGLYHVDTDKLGVSIAGAKVGEFNSNGYSGLTNRIVLQDRKPNNTAPQTSVVGDNDRNINTVIFNGITGASLGTNNFVLPVGRYYIKSIKCSSGVNYVNFTRLYNVTSASDQTDVNGNTIVSIGAYGGSDYSFAELAGYYFDVVTSAKTFKIIHYTSNANSFGGASNQGFDEVYTTIEIEKVG
jgi:hypothetical protein